LDRYQDDAAWLSGAAGGQGRSATARVQRLMMKYGANLAAGLEDLATVRRVA